MDRSDLDSGNPITPTQAFRKRSYAFELMGATHDNSSELEASPDLSLEARLRIHGRIFGELWSRDRSPRLFFSPGRVNLMGAHLDYNGGAVMPMAIDRGTYLAVGTGAAAGRPSGRPGLLRFASTALDAAFEWDLDELPSEPIGEWVDYPLGVLKCALAQLSEDKRQSLRGADVLYGGNLPVAAGLSSSASICVGTIFALNRVWELGFNEAQCVQIALDAEREFVGVQCGIMDPFAVGFARPGNLLHLDCRNREIEHVPLDSSQLLVGVADTGVRRKLAQGEFNRRVQECSQAFEQLSSFAPDANCLAEVPMEVLESQGQRLSETVRKRARHVISEVQRTQRAKRALQAGEVAIFGQMMLEAHHSLRVDYEVSCPELDCLIDAGSQVPGVLGGRLTGAGFGGCAVFLLERSAQDRFTQSLAESFEPRFGRKPPTLFFSGSGGPVEV